MKRSLLFPILFFAVLVAGCEKHDPSPSRVYRKSYIDNFYYPLSEIRARSWHDVEVDEQNKTIALYPGNYETFRSNRTLVLVLRAEYGIPDAERDQELKKSIGDTHYNRKIYRWDGLYAVADTLSTITVTCNANYDDAHPAGSSLNDIFAVYFNNPYRYIQNDYKMFRHGDEYLNLRQSFENDSWLMTGSKLTEIDFEANPFLGDELYFVLQQPPKQTGEYTFTFSVKKANGEVLTASTPAITLNAE